MTSRSSSCRATPTLVLGFSSCKSVIDFHFSKGTVSSSPPASTSESESDGLMAQEKGTPAPNHTNTPAPSHTSIPAPSHTSTPTPNHISTPASGLASTPALAKSTLIPKYSEADLMMILKMFLETKDQKPKAEVPRERLS